MRAKKVPNTKGVIYKLIFPSGKVYIGKTVEGIKKRVWNHLYRAFKKELREYNTKLSRAIRKYGKESVSCEILYDDIDRKDLSALEISAIKEYDSKNNGYNGTDGGEGAVGYVHSARIRRKMCKIRREVLDKDPQIIRKGENSILAKLTNEEAAEIRRRYQEEGSSQEKLAEEYGMSRGALGCVIRNETYYDNDFNIDIKKFNKGIKIDTDKANQIRRLFAAGDRSITSLCVQFNVCRQTIHNILRNKIWIDKTCAIKDEEIDRILSRLGLRPRKKK